MNLLLYAESRTILARTSGDSTPAHPSGPTTFDLSISLPDSLFEELGYFGALEEEQTLETEGDDSLEGLFRWLVVPTLNY